MIITQKGPNCFLASLFIEELGRNGLTDIVISPGSRSTPLVAAALEKKSLRCFPHPDERGAAFFALGMSKVTRKPTALVCTSGSALGHYLPAIMEAFHTNTPLIILSADRPLELIQTGSNQTTIQNKIYANFLTWEAEVPPPDTTEYQIYSIRTANFAYFKSLNGPVHINFKFRKPLLSSNQPRSAFSEEALFWLNTEKPYRQHYYLDNFDPIDQLAAKLEFVKQGLIIAGPIYEDREINSLKKLAKLIGFPVVAEVTSGTTFDGELKIITNVAKFTETLYRNKDLTPETIIHVGGNPTFENLYSVINKNVASRKIDLTCIHISKFDKPIFLANVISHQFHGSIEYFLKGLNESRFLHSKVSGDTYFKKILKYSTLTKPSDKDSSFTVKNIIEQLFRKLQKRSLIYLANSLNVRYADEATPAKINHLIGSHRGLSGIDGTIAIAAGMSLKTKLKSYLVCGDVAFYHDLNSLRLLYALQLPFTLIITDNQGGKIFSSLPEIGKLTYYKDFFEMPTKLDYEAVAKSFFLGFRKITTLEELSSYLEEREISGVLAKPEIAHLVIT
jgi:2-succinyl-5-enolpyruvyl-6-hydroxy-3-cyclohexene-1-carboxylate synthase